MSRTLKVYSGEDQTPVYDITDLIEWPEAEFAHRANLGEGALSRIRFRDEDGRTGSSTSLPAGLTPIFLNPHNVVIWQESGVTMGRMRISPKDWTRGEQVVNRAREAVVQLDDYNVDLHKIVVHDYSRPSETDKARVQHLMATYLSGSPRRTTNLNGSNYVSGSNLVTLPATTYTRTTTFEVLASIAAAANKQFFVTVDGELFYDGNDSTAYSCPFKISDRDTDLSSTVFAPQPSGFGPASSEDGQQMLSGLWLFYGDTQYVHVTNPTAANTNSWWEDIIYDDTVTTAAAATTLANAILAQRVQEERQYAVKIGPLTYGQAIQIKAGQIIQIKWRAIPDADDAYVSRRISELRWSTPEPFSFFADMILDRPIRVHGQGQKIDTVIPKPSPAEGGGFYDSFGRTASRSIANPSTVWNTTDSGHTWTITHFAAPSDATYVDGGASVNGDAGVLAQDFDDPGPWITATSDNVSEVLEPHQMLTARFRLVASNPLSSSGVVLSFALGGPGWAVLEIHVTSPADGSDGLWLYENTGLVQEFGAYFTMNTWYQLRWERQMVSGISRAKIWLDSGSEPSAFQIEDVPYDYRVDNDGQIDVSMTANVTGGGGDYFAWQIDWIRLDGDAVTVTTF